jgi:serine/threonine-protein kinase
LRFGQLASSIEQIHETSMLLPLHDTGRENRAIRERMDRIRGEMNRIGKIAEKPGHYALGRGFMALENWPEARSHLEAAVREDPGDAAAQLALGQALSMLYRLSRVEIYSLTDAAERKYRLRQCRQELGEPALNHLRAGLGAAGDTREYGEALIAYCEGRYDDAIRLAGNAWHERPAFYPAGILHGLGYVDRGAERIQRAQLAEAEADLLRAGEVFARLLEIARSQPELRRLEAVRRVNLLRIDRERDSLTDGRTAWAFQACADLLRVDPQSDQAHYLQALLHEMAAEIAGSRGQDPTPRMEAALSEIRQALKIQPDAASYWNWLGIVLKTAAEYKLGRGIIDKELIGQSLEASRHSLRLRPNNPKAYNCIGITCRLKAFAAMLEGADQRPPLREAITALKEAHRLNPDYSDPYQNLALIYQDLTYYELNYGLDPRDSARQAMSWCEQAVLHVPQNSYITVIRSGILLALAIFDLNAGGDGQAIRRYLAAAQAAAGANPRNAHAQMQLSQTNQLLARWQMRRGEDPAAAIRIAKAAGERTAALDAGNPYGFHALAGAWLAEVEWVVRQGKDPGRPLAEAERFARRCVRMIPADIEMSLLLAQVFRWQAEANLADGRDPGGPARQGLALLAAAARMDPREARVPALHGEIRLILARAGSDPEKARSEAGQAAALFQEALRLNPYLRLELAPSLERALSLRQPAPAAKSRPLVEG